MAYYRPSNRYNVDKGVSRSPNSMATGTQGTHSSLREEVAWNRHVNRLKSSKQSDYPSKTGQPSSTAPKKNNQREATAEGVGYPFPGATRSYEPDCKTIYYRPVEGASTTSARVQNLPPLSTAAAAIKQATSYQSYQNNPYTSPLSVSADQEFELRPGRETVPIHQTRVNHDSYGSPHFKEIGTGEHRQALSGGQTIDRNRKPVEPDDAIGRRDLRIRQQEDFPREKLKYNPDGASSPHPKASSIQTHEPMEIDTAERQSTVESLHNIQRSIDESQIGDYALGQRDNQDIRSSTRNQNESSSRHHSQKSIDDPKSHSRYTSESHYKKDETSPDRHPTHEEFNPETTDRKNHRSWDEKKTPPDVLVKYGHEYIRKELTLEQNRYFPKAEMTRAANYEEQNVEQEAFGVFPDYRDKDSFLMNCCRKKHGTNPQVYVPIMRETSRDLESSLRKFEIGNRATSNPEKVVMLVGLTGAGKSTMINAVFNYMFGIEWEDEYRLKLIEEGQMVNQAVSQTNTITAYTIHHQPWFTVPYTVTIVDTPGFGDTGGLKRDKEIMEQIRKFFMTKGPNGIHHLDAVGFVAQSSMPRLTPIQRYVFDSILSIFGKDVAQNIFMLLTFADGQKPQVLSGLKEANMEFQNFYKFNNSALYVNGNDKNYEDHEETEDSEEDEDDDNYFDQMFWKMGASNFTKFMTDLDNAVPRSLQLTAEVLEERNTLEVTINGIHENIKIGLKNLENLKREQQILKHHQSDIDKNRNFTYEVDETVLSPTENDPGVYSLNCMRCQRTCHGKCSRLVRLCKVLILTGYCTTCPRQCSYSYHQKQSFKYVIETVKVTRTSEELKRRYEEAAGRELSAKQLIEKCNKKFDAVQTETLEFTERARKCLKRLNEIALKPNPLSTTDYIDLMIQEEEFLAKPGWRDTVNQLEEIKQRADFTQNFTDEGFNPFDTSLQTKNRKGNR